ncbi:hypothetical protein ACFY8S_01545 [Streptomyces hygroscopicus]|uniref:hypothetical protein n=1 Tax=Streptomyces hygroscopicus TaxID=1912 RepID=UPI0036A6DBEF
MTTAVRSCAVWIRLMGDSVDLTLIRPPGAVMWLSVWPVPYDGYLDPLTVGPSPQIRMAVDFVPADVTTAARCEEEARRTADALGAGKQVRDLLPVFSLEAVLGGREAPHTRVTASRLTLTPDDEPTACYRETAPRVRAFTAAAHPDGDGRSYVIRQRPAS